MPWTQQANIRFGFWLTAFVPVLIGVLGILSIRSLSDSAATLAQTNRTIQHLDRVYIQLSELDAAESEYIVTGDQTASKTLDEVQKRLAADIAHLREITDNNADQKMWMVNLQALYESKLAEMRRTIELRQSAGPEAAAHMLAERLHSVDGSTIKDIRTTIRGIRRSEQAQLDERTATQTRSIVGTTVAFGLVLLLNLGLVWTLWRSIRREAYKARREEARIRELNLELERRVERRTRALQRSNEDLQQFAYAVSHDLKEPLRTIGSYSELLRRKYYGKLDQEADEHIRFVTEGVKRMDRMIRDLLEYARAGQGEETTTEDVNSEEVLESVLRDLQPRIAEANACVTHDPLPSVKAQSVWFSALLQNLVGNALKYHGDSPARVHISAHRNGFETVFSVKDNGIGIDPKYSDQVFGVFKRLHGGEVEGTGIGLATCKRIVERAGGRIWFESQPGQGSTFYFSIPS